MLIAEINSAGDLSTIAQYAETTRLGRDIHQTGMIGRQGLIDTMHILQKYQTIADQYHAEKMTIVGTQVFRLAQNRDDILKTILKKTGLSVEILTAEQEAEYSFQGAVSGKQISNTLVMDIGGGSTEMIIGENGVIQNTISLPVGAVVMTDQFLKTDPPDPISCAKLKAYVTDQIPDTWKKQLNINPCLICVGGTATTLAALHLQLKTYDANQVDGFSLTPQNIQQLLDRFCDCQLKDRQTLLSLDPKRADIIIAGTLILQTILDMTANQNIMISDRGLRYGIGIREFKSFH
ncbi:hypothetical protein ACFL4L_06565 [bacterium]